MDAMQVRVLLFGIAKEIVESSSVQIAVAPHMTVGKLKEKIVAEYPEMGKLKSLMIAVNQKYASDDTLINEGDEVAVIPPVSGG